MLLDDLPPGLEELVRSLYPDEVMARRALLAPWPDLDFRSAYEKRHLWCDNSDPERRKAFEGLLEAHRLYWLARRDQPYFPAEGTEGKLQSPYPELSDREYWLFVSLWGSEEGARTWLEKPLPTLAGSTSRAFLSAARKYEQPPRGPLGRLIERLLGMKEIDARLTVWNAHIDVVAGNYQ